MGADFGPSIPAEGVTGLLLVRPCVRWAASLAVVGGIHCCLLLTRTKVRPPARQVADPPDACTPLAPPPARLKGSRWVALIARTQGRDACTFDIKV